MKKYLLLTIILTLSFSIVLATELHVGTGQQYLTISSAYNAAQDGDEIIIHPGNYFDHLDVELNIDITGSTLEPNDVTIESDNPSYSVFHLEQIRCNISNLTISNSDNGISMFVAESNIENCVVANNDWIGISCTEFSTVNISNCVIKNNGRSGVLLEEQFPDRNSTIENTLICYNGFGGLPDSGAGIRTGEGIISNCTIVNNRRGVCYSDWEHLPSIINSIIYDNELLQVSSIITEVTYSNVQGGLTGTGNTGANPHFADPNNGDYHLTDASPCIDSGHPDWFDPDGSRSDMGVIPFEHEEDIKFFHADYNWISFPKLPVDGTSNTNQPVSADNIMDILNDPNPFPLFLELLYSNDNEPVLKFENTAWQPEPEGYDLKSSRGYKLKTEDPENTEISIVGLRLEEDTEIDLQYGENWVGYWLPESQDIDDAFGEDFDKVVSVKAEDWEWKDMRPIRGLHDPVPIYYPIRPLQYGKGYVIRLREPISNFQWHTGNPAIVKEIPKAEGFEYNVLPDYESVIIDTIEGGENVVEVGAFVDDVCVGAAVVEEYPAQLLAYTGGANRSSGLTFQVIGGERGEAQKAMYRTLNLQTGDFENMSIFPGRLEHNIVKLNIKTLQDPEVPIPNVFNLERNYPNPFNPTTTISFSVAQTTSDVSLEIFNIKGQKVKTLYSGIAEEGKHSIVWNGKDTNDKPVSSGIYFYKLTTGKKELTRKMLMLK